MQEFLLLLAVGAALVAFWIVARFPERRPTDFPRALAHVLMSILAASFAPGVVTVLAARGPTMTMVAVFGIIFPVLVYTFLAAAWFLKIAHDMMARYR
jgi:hypothetical protein